MPSYFFHLKFELYPSPPPGSGYRGNVWVPNDHSSIFDDLPPHPSPPTAPLIASQPSPQPPQARPQSRIDTESDTQGTANPCAATLKDWRFGPVSVESIDIDDEMTPHSTLAAAAVGPSLGSAGKATKARYTEAQLGWGIVHLYREGDETPELQLPLHGDGRDESQLDCTIVCIPAVPSYLSPSDFLGFVGDKWKDQISHYRMVMTARMSRYLVLMKFRDSKQAQIFGREFDGRVFNHIEPETCNIAFIRSITFDTPTAPSVSFPDLKHDPFAPSTMSEYQSLKPYPPPTPDLIELPTCPVCLERMDDTAGLLTILCQHVFHCSCLQKWKGSGCPVCRHTNQTAGTAPNSPYEGGDPYKQPFGSNASNFCSVCDSTDDLWICLVCGNVGCGRYKRGHAKEHWKNTAHTFSLELDTQHVWDYAGDMWVHRLIRDKGDGKLVELPGHQQGPATRDSEDMVPRAKLDNMGWEYTHLLTSQLESQRVYFEEMLSKAADKAAQALAASEEATAQATKAQEELRDTKQEQERVKRETVPSLERDLERARTRADKSADLARKLGASYQEEKKVSEGLMKRIEHVSKEVSTLTTQLEAMKMENADLQDQNHDLSMFISGQEKLKELEAEGKLDETEVQEGNRPNHQEMADGGTKKKELYPMTPWKYDAFLHTFSVLVDLFFREVHPRGAWRIPKSGPILFVAAPHANQFVDGLVLQRTLKEEANRRVGLLVAEKSVHGFIGWGSRQTGSVPVGRAQDKAKPAKGLVYMPDPINDPTLIRGVGTDFEKEAQVGGMIFLPSVKGRSGSSVDIAKVLGPEELRTKRPFSGDLALSQLTGRDDIDNQGSFTRRELTTPRPGHEGTKYKLAPHTDQTEVYNAVFTRLRSGGCIGIFPEGGSHDRTELLPLKAGVAIMALGTLAEDPDCGLQIVPVGMNYFHAHKFRSRAVVEFGYPFHIPPDVVSKYKNNQRRDAIAQTLDMVHQALSSVTVSAPDYDTLMCIQAARRLYNTGKKLPLPKVVELNRRLAVGFSKYRQDPRIVDLMDNLRDYNRQLRYLNIKDHQLHNAKRNIPTVIFLLFYRIAKLLVLSVGVVPGLVLFAPVFVATKYISHQKAKEALAGSSVKIQGRDVMATWKLLVAMAFAPALYNLYSISLAVKVYQDHLWGYLPEYVPFWLVYVIAWIIFPAVTFAAFRIGEVGMDILKSLRPLVLCISPTSSYSVQKLRERRALLSEQVVKVINDLGPDMYADFEKTRLVSDPFRNDSFVSSLEEAHLGTQSPGSQSTASTPPDSPRLARRNTTRSSRAMPRNESFSNIGAIGIFPTRPPSRSHSRSESGSRSRSSSAGGGAGLGGFPIAGFTALDAQEDFQEANNRIRAAMQERGQLRRRKSGTSVQGGEEDGA
ncbi:glycerol-3-phosphate acyltransferase [Xylariaceae sp. FL0255]|nr:glycerol-3-phosphate acyltransferase [Xylariaceae sp. FL0255]